MNYFSVPSVLVSGIEAIFLHVECAQSRRLPYLQVIGGSAGPAAEMRERVIAALDGARLRLPARRITVQIQPSAPGWALEPLDLAVAVAILGSSGLIPPASAQGLLFCASLGLDGRLRPVGNHAALRGLLESGRFRAAVVAESEAAGLGEGAWGFANLAEVVRFLRGEIPAPLPLPLAPEVSPPAHPPLAPGAWPASAVAQRLLEIAAAGEHHALLFAPPSARADLWAAALAFLLPELGRRERAEVRAVYELAGREPAYPPCVAFGAESGLPPLLRDRSFAKVEEACLAHRGVLFVDQILEREDTLFPKLRPALAEGRLATFAGGHRVEVPCAPLVLAVSALCACGRRGEGLCLCRPTEARRYQARARRLLRHPFDLCLTLAPAPGLLPPVPWEEIAARVVAARARMLDRQGRPNGRLKEEAWRVVKPWARRAVELFRVFEGRDPGARAHALARVAVTISDLRGAREVGELDLFEARHYFPAAGGEEGSRPARLSAPAVNESAMP